MQSGHYTTSAPSIPERHYPPTPTCVCRAPSDAEGNLDMPTRLTLQRYRNEASAAKYEMGAVMKELKRHRREHERVQQQQQISIRGLKEQVSLGQQALQQQVARLATSFTPMVPCLSSWPLSSLFAPHPLGPKKLA